MCHIRSQLETMTHLPTLFQPYTHTHNTYPYKRSNRLSLQQFATEQQHDKSSNIAHHTTTIILLMHIKLPPPSAHTQDMHTKIWLDVRIVDNLPLSVFNTAMFNARDNVKHTSIGIRLIEWRISRGAQLVIQYCNAQQQKGADLMYRFKGMVNLIPSIFAYASGFYFCLSWICRRKMTVNGIIFIFSVGFNEELALITNTCYHHRPHHQRIWYLPRLCSHIRFVLRFRVPHCCQYSDGTAPKMSWWRCYSPMMPLM